MEPEVEGLTETRIFEAGRTLARALQNDPFEKYVFPDDEERAQRSPAHFSPFVRLGYLYGEVLTTVGLTGVSVWMPPGSEPTADEALRSGFRQLPGLIGDEAFTRFGSVLDYCPAPATNVFRHYTGTLSWSGSAPSCKAADTGMRCSDRSWPEPMPKVYLFVSILPSLGSNRFMNDWGSDLYLKRSIRQAVSGSGPSNAIPRQDDDRPHDRRTPPSSVCAWP